MYTDYVYRRKGERVYGERAFLLFVNALRDHADLTVIGRLEREPGTWHYALPDDVRFVGLPHYRQLTEPRTVMRGLVVALRRFWRALDDLDVVWLLGPHPYAIAFVLMARARRRRVVLGVRQDLPSYVRSRHPGRRVFHLAADALEGVWRLLARGLPVVVVGPDLARSYERSRAVLALTVSLVSEEDIVEPEAALARWDAEGPRRIVSVGRLDAEKNPLLLADVLARLRRDGADWRLVVCGDGPMSEQLDERMAQLGVREAADLRGYVGQGHELRAVYRSGHALLHVSWTEGLPQVLFEAFAAGLPVVATAVGGVEAAAGEAALLVAPGAADPPAAHLEAIAADATLRHRLVHAGSELVRRRTLEAEVGRTADFLRAGS